MCYRVRLKQGQNELAFLSLRTHKNLAGVCRPECRTVPSGISKGAYRAAFLVGGLGAEVWTFRFWK